MTNFTQLFNTVQNTPKNDHSNHISAELLIIYASPPLYYKDINNFDVCKEQLLKLLNYIVSLAPEKLKIFAEYRDNIASSLTLNSHAQDIEITLRAAKNTLESNISLIQDNFHQVSGNVLDRYTTSVCFSGAFSNLESILEHFNQNNLRDLIVPAKKKMLQSIIFDFLRTSGIEIPVSNEIHMVNGLYNLFSEQYACPTVEDRLASMHFHDRTISYSKNYIEEHFSVSSFVETLMTMVPLPPEATLDSAERLSEMETFFRFLGIDNNHKKYLYTLDDDCINLIPKPNFSTYLKCIIISKLVAHGYVGNAYINFSKCLPTDHPKVIALDIGTELIEIKIYNETKEMEYSIFDEKTIDLIINGCKQKIIQENDEIARYFKCLYTKIIKNSIHRICDALESGLIPEYFHFYFNLLMKEKHLPEEIVIRLFSLLFDKNEFEKFRPYFAKYVCNRLYSLEKKQISMLIRHIPHEDIEHYINIALNNEKYDYVEALLHKENLPPHVLETLIFWTIDSLDLHAFKIAISRLDELGFPLNTINSYDAEPLVHEVIKKGFSESEEKKECIFQMLDELVKYGVNLDCINQNGHTAAQVAYMKEDLNVPLLRKLISLGATLNTVDENGKEIICLTATENKISIHYVINNILKRYAFLDNGPIIDWKKILDHRLPKNFTLAHYAAIYNKFDFFDLLKKYEVSLEQKDFLGWAPIFHTIKNKNKEAFCALATLGVDLQTKDKNGNTLAHQICKDRLFNTNAKIEWLTLISQYGAKLDEKNNEGKTALDTLPTVPGKKTYNTIAGLIERLTRETSRNQELQTRSPSILTQFDSMRASKKPKRDMQDTIHSPSSSRCQQR